MLSLVVWSSQCRYGGTRAALCSGLTLVKPDLAMQPKASLILFSTSRRHLLLLSAKSSGVRLDQRSLRRIRPCTTGGLRLSLDRRQQHESYEQKKKNALVESFTRCACVKVWTVVVLDGIFELNLLNYLDMQSSRHPAGNQQETMTPKNTAPYM
jgi:hypothetical protein